MWGFTKEGDIPETLVPETRSLIAELAAVAREVLATPTTKSTFTDELFCSFWSTAKRLAAAMEVITRSSNAVSWRVERRVFVSAARFSFAHVAVKGSCNWEATWMS
jgi:hypothetical protein